MKENNKEEDKELRIILRKDDTEIVKNLKDILSKNDVEDLFVDFGQGDKFLIQDINISKNSRTIEFLVSKHSTRWIEMGVKHPIKLTNDE